MSVPAMAPTNRSDAGYSLVAVIVALVLLSVGIVSLSSVMTQSVVMQTMAAMRTSAAYVATAYMEDVRGRDPATLASESAVSVDEQGLPDVNGVFTRELIIGDAGRNLISVTVRVTSPRTSPVTLVTWIYDGA